MQDSLSRLRAQVTMVQWQDWRKSQRPETKQNKKTVLELSLAIKHDTGLKHNKKARNTPYTTIQNVQEASAATRRGCPGHSVKLRGETSSRRQRKSGGQPRGQWERQSRFGGQWQRWLAKEKAFKACHQRDLASCNTEALSAGSRCLGKPGADSSGSNTSWWNRTHWLKLRLLRCWLLCWHDGLSGCFSGG